MQIHVRFYTVSLSFLLFIWHSQYYVNHDNEQIDKLTKKKKAYLMEKVVLL